jgi:uncharacterized membrane protein
MVLEESFQFVALLVITLGFTFATLIKNDYRLLFKVVASLCWFVMALTQIYYFGGGQLLAVPLMFLFTGLGLIFTFSIVTDFKDKERDRVYGWMDQD